MILTDEQSSQINFYVIKHFKKDHHKTNPIFNIDNDNNITIKIVDSAYMVSPYILHQFSRDLYSIGFQIYLGWEFIYIHFYQPNSIEIEFKILEMI